MGHARWVALAGGRTGRPSLWWCAVQHFSNRRWRRPREDGGAGPRGPRSCPAEPSGGGGPDQRGRRTWLPRPAERGDQREGESPWWGEGISQRGWGWVEPQASAAEGSAGLGAEGRCWGGGLAPEVHVSGVQGRWGNRKEKG